MTAMLPSLGQLVPSCATMYLCHDLCHPWARGGRLHPIDGLFGGSCRTKSSCDCDAHTSNDPTRIAFYTFVQGYPNNFGYPGPLDNCVFAIGIFELVEVCIYNNFEDNVITM
jgi:hypothetical protein